MKLDVMKNYPAPTLVEILAELPPENSDFGSRAMNYYNEFAPRAAEWLRKLILSGLIPDCSASCGGVCKRFLGCEK